MDTQVGTSRKRTKEATGSNLSGEQLRDFSCYFVGRECDLYPLVIFMCQLYYHLNTFRSAECEEEEASS